MANASLMPREFYVPKCATKVADKASDAVAYLYSGSDGKPCARIFFGKQTKPIASYRFRSDKEREAYVTRAFNARRERASRINERREQRKAFVPQYQVGDLFRTCWGYDQTNVEFFEIVEIKGKHAVLREVAQVREATGWEQGKCVPQSGSYIGQPIRRLMQDGRIKIDDVRTAWPWGKRVAGVVVGDAAEWTSYA